MTRIEPKHVAASNNAKYTTNPNNNYWLSCVRLYILQFNILSNNTKEMYINIKWCVSQTQQIFIMFIIVLGQHVSILIESSSGPSRIQILT